MIRTELVRDAASLAALEAPWWGLWREAGGTPFTSPAWLVPWAEAFRPAELRTIALWRDDRLVGLLPLWREDRPDLGRRLLPLGIGLSDLFDVLLDPGEPGAAASLSAALAALPSDWDLLSLEALPEDAAALGLPFDSGWTRTIDAPDSRAVLALGPGGTFGCLPARQGRKLRMTRHRVARQGGLVVEAGPAEAAEFLGDLVRLHGLRWETRDEPGVLADPAVLLFHGMALPRLLRAGLARATRLLVGERCVGAYYGLRDGHAAYGYLGGFDPDFAPISPGALLLGDAIDATCAADLGRFDFLRGREPYKYAWGAVDRPNHRLILARP